MPLDPSVRDSLALAAFAAAALLGPVAAAIAAAFLFGLLIGRGR